MKVALYTLGCKVNRYDTEIMRSQFQAAGYEIVDFTKAADVYIINTCTVTHGGARKSRKITRKVRRRQENALIAVVGCYPQVNIEEVLASAEIDLVVGTTDRNKIVEFVEQALKADNKPLNFVRPVAEEKEFEPVRIEDFEGRTRATIKIQEGCDQFCSYCIIPYARGRVRSRKLARVVDEVNKLAEEGFKEIVLTGIHLGEYGKNNSDLSLEKLLKELVQVEGIERIRLSSIEGTEVSEELINLIAKSDKLCRHLHLPLQSGSDKILAAMNRPYDKNDFKQMVYEIRDKIPDIAITTDVIVGFPGETESDFTATCEVVKDLEFSDIHVFKYSSRQGTPAADFPNQVHSKVKKARSKHLREIAAELKQEYKEKFVGDTMNVLVEEKRNQATGLLTGLTDNYLRIAVEGTEQLVGQLISVKLRWEEGKLIGSLENNG